MAVQLFDRTHVMVIRSDSGAGFRPIRDGYAAELPGTFGLAGHWAVEMGERDQSKTEDSKDVQVDLPVDLPVQTDIVATPPEAPPAGDATLDPELQAFIGRQLKATY